MKRVKKYKKKLADFIKDHPECERCENNDLKYLKHDIFLDLGPDGGEEEWYRYHCSLCKFTKTY